MAETNPTAALRCGQYHLPLAPARIMGILNVTPDSFSDGGLYLDPAAALIQARQMQAAGAHIIDVGGESTRPGAQAVSVEEELRRVIPVISALSSELGLPVSVDTSKPEVMRAALEAGAGMVNDVNALRAPGALELLAEYPQVAVVLMHMQGQPRTMQKKPQYADVVEDVSAFLSERRAVAIQAGIRSKQIVVDPGLGFGKTLPHNLSLLKATPKLVQEFGPVLIGVSRKSMFTHLLGELDLPARVAASVQTAMLAANGGAAILRVHDVQETARALRVLQAIETAN